MDTSSPDEQFSLVLASRYAPGFAQTIEARQLSSIERLLVAERQGVCRSCIAIASANQSSPESFFAIAVRWPSLGRE